MTKTDLATWNFLSDLHNSTHVSPTIRDVAEHFGIGNHSAWKRVQKLVELGYVAPQNGKQGITLLMMPGIEDSIPWIKCSERKPDTGKPVWIVGNGVVQHCAYKRVGIGFACRDGYEWVTCDVLESDPVPDDEPSHWMYVPDPPKEKA